MSWRLENLSENLSETKFWLAESIYYFTYNFKMRVKTQIK